MKKLWGIRHIRYYVKALLFAVWWKRVGHYMGAVPNAADLEYLEDVWQGRA